MCDEEYLSNTSVCLKFTNDLSKLNEDDQRAFAKSIGKILTEEEVAFDIVNHRSAPLVYEYGLVQQLSLKIF